MKFVFVSNFLNHHQMSFCREMLSLCEEFYFIATEAGASWGYQRSTNAEYVIDYFADKERADSLILAADAVIYGGCPNYLIDMRMKENKLSFLYSERFLKKGLWRRFIPSVRKQIVDRIIKYKKKNIFVLCASSYLPEELSLLGFSVEKCFKWGYFPELKRYDDIDSFVAKKKANSILWCGRLIDLKHPELAIEIAKRLKAENYCFTLDIVGNGELEENISDMVVNNDLSDCHQ